MNQSMISILMQPQWSSILKRLVSDDNDEQTKAMKKRYVLYKLELLDRPSK